MGWTASWAIPNDVRIWAVDVNGNLVSKISGEGLIKAGWSTHVPPAGESCSVAGTSSYSFGSGSASREDAYCVSGDHLLRRRITASGALSWTVITDLPAAYTLSGQIEAFTEVNTSGVRYLQVFASGTNPSGTPKLIQFYTTTSGSGACQNGDWCYYEHVAPPNSATVDTVSSIAQAFHNTWSRVFVRVTEAAAGELHYLRGNGAPSTYSWFDAGKPSATVQVRGELDAIAGNLGATATLGVFVAATDTTIWWKSMTTGAFGSWTQIYSTTPPTVSTANYSLAATTYGDCTPSPCHGAFGVFFRAATPAGKLHRILNEGDGNGWTPQPPENLGTPTDANLGNAAVMAMPFPLGGHLAFMIGRMSSTAAYYLYTWADKWATHVTPDDDIVVSSASYDRAEGVIAEYKGRLLATGIVRDPGLFYVRANYSSDDGLTWPAETSMAGGWSACGEVANYFSSDPTATWDGGGTGYVTYLSWCNDEASCSDSTSDATRVFYRTTTDGSTFSDPVTVASGGAYAVAFYDHPWVTYQVSPNRVHFAYWEFEDRTTYHKFFEGGPMSGEHTVTTDSDGPPMAFVGAGPDYQLYIAWQDWSTMSRVNLCRYTCTPSPPPGETCSCSDITDLRALLEDGSSVGYVGYADTCIPPSMGNYLRTQTGWSFAPSPTDPNVVYYVWHRSVLCPTCADWTCGGATQTQPHQGRKDVYFAKLTWNGTAWATPGAVGVNENLGDDTDQFTPAVHATDDDFPAGETIHVLWYDRRGDPSLCGGVANRCYQPWLGVSTDGGASFVNESEGPLSDPINLADHCGRPGQKFIGDYHVGYGGSVHTHMNWTNVAAGAQPAIHQQTTSRFHY